MSAPAQVGPSPSGGGPTFSSRLGARGRPLTEHQLDALRRASMGQTQKQIARDLGVDVSTVGSLFHDVFRKLGAWNMAHAVHLACEVGILPKSPLVDLPNALSDVLRLVAEGRTNAEIAEMLGRPVYTVVDQVKEARRRLGARDRAHAAALAVALNLVRVDVRPFLTPESVDAA